MVRFGNLTNRTGGAGPEMLLHHPALIQVVHCKNIWVTSTIFWLSQLHACCVGDTLQTSREALILNQSVVGKLLPLLN